MIREWLYYVLGVDMLCFWSQVVLWITIYCQVNSPYFQSKYYTALRDFDQKDDSAFKKNIYS